MIKFITSMIVIMFMVGCETHRDLGHLDRLGERTIPVVEMDHLTVENALNIISQEWRKQTGTPMPVAVVTLNRHFEPEDAQHHLVTLRAHDVSFLEILHLVADLSGYRLTFRDGSILVADIWPGESMTFQWKFDQVTKTVLGLPDKPSGDDIRHALAARGVDFSKGDMNVTFATNDLYFIGGFTENADIAKAVLKLAKSGYEVKPTASPNQAMHQQPVAGK
jgi:hypothetical protein